MKRTLIVAVAVALISVASAQAHYGDKWFQTTSLMQQNIEDKYQIDVASCRPKKDTGHWTQDNGWSIRRWDHFICGVSSEVTGRVCVVVAHQAGQYWNSIVLTGYKFAKGPTCVARDLRQR